MRVRTLATFLSWKIQKNSNSKNCLLTAVFAKSLLCAATLKVIDKLFEIEGFCDYFENKLETKQNACGNLDPLH